MCDEGSSAEVTPLDELSTVLVMVGALTSLVSVASNTLLLYSLLAHPRCYKCYFHFLCFLSMMDIVVSVLYIPVIAIDHWKDSLSSVYLARFWWTYFRVLLTVTHVAMAASSYILSAALLERFLITIRSSYAKEFTKRRTFLCSTAIVIALFARGPMLFELVLVHMSECIDTVNEYVVDLAPHCNTVWYGSVYRFWLRNIITVFVPFSLLFLINVRTVQVLKLQLSKGKLSARRKFSVNVVGKKKVRAATWTLLFVCLTYLLSNLPNVVITAWEFIDFDSLKELNEFYMFSTDLVSILVVVSCALRLPIYMLSNAELRRVVRRALFQRSKTTHALLKNATALYTLNIKGAMIEEHL